MPSSSKGGSHREMHSQASLEHGRLSGEDSIATHRRNGSSQAQLAAVAAMNDGPSQRLRSHSAQSEIPDSLHGTNEAKFEARDNKRHLVVETPGVTRQPQQPKDKITSLQDELKAARAQNSRQIDDVHSQYGEIAHLKHQIRQAYESATEMEEDLHNTIIRLTDTLHKRDREVSKLTRDVKLERHNANVSDITHVNTIHGLQKQLAGLTEQLQMTTKEKDRAINNLEDCKERIFQMQPLQAMTDDQISNAYRSLCESIDTWVATAFADVTDGLNTMMAIMCSKDAAYDRTRYIQPVQVELAQRFPLVDNVLLGLFFFTQVYDKLLNPRRMSPGLPESLERILRVLVDGLKRVQPAKDDEAIEMWRVDLQRSLGVSKFVEEKKAEAYESLRTDIAKHFSTIMPPDQDRKALSEEYHKIIAAAADLALNIRLSTVHYTLDFVADLDVPESRVLTDTDMQNYEIINADTGLPLRASSLVIADKEGRVGEKLCTVRPALVREDRDGSKGLVLVKEAIIVNFNQKVGKKARRKQAQKGANMKEVVQASEMLIDLGERRDAFV